MTLDERGLCFRSLEVDLGDSSKDISISMIGDSITWGLGASGNASVEPRNQSKSDARDHLTTPSWVNLFRNWIGAKLGSSHTIRTAGPGVGEFSNTRRLVRVSNCGILGTSTSHWLPGSQLLSAALEGKPTHAFVMLGTNDRGLGEFYEGIEGFNNRLQKIVEFLRDNRIKVALMCAPKATGRFARENNDFYRFCMEDVSTVIGRVAQDYHCDFVNHIECGDQLASAGSAWTVDGLHPNDSCYTLMAENIIRRISA